LKMNLGDPHAVFAGGVFDFGNLNLLL
jgi:hypothetical protein